MPKLAYTLEPTQIEWIAIRAQGAGGQNVNKVETMVEAYFHVAHSLDNICFVYHQKQIHKDYDPCHLDSQYNHCLDYHKQLFYVHFYSIRNIK